MEALTRFIAEQPKRVLDLGCGFGEHADIMRKAGMNVTEVDYMLGNEADDISGELGQFDGIWCSHVLEHQLNVNDFLSAVRLALKKDGLLAITVPPAKNNIVGGHVTLWNEGLLLYNLILAGFDCSEARVGVYGYNISVLVRRKDARLPILRHDKGDIEALARYFPCDVKQGFDGRTGPINWELNDG